MVNVAIGEIMGTYLEGLGYRTRWEMEKPYYSEELEKISRQKNMSLHNIPPRIEYLQLSGTSAVMM